ncbi:histidinol-phosphate transaminase [Lacihabitans soyangensis]|uniref:Histidinol-phosphate aminotransferase n=1 Tax=Lacihabitans soyangensis TaxID=869394 RepID=A0AAE3H413_9BACT|nr:histidinol-phosphate transaminase [Lacihabitans soyangensis]MCP9764503.1 histidinol-phosphate transaminase [Lacihabitans soyangensis]
MDFNQLIRPHILKLQPYASARDEYSGKEGTFLDANENPFSSVSGENFNRYPDPYQWEIKNKLSVLKGVSPESIFLGNGSDEPIDLLIKAVCEPLQNNIVIMPPTYGMYKVCADIQQVYVQQAPLSEAFDIDLDNVFDAINSATKMIWICSPNNPSGNLVNRDAIYQILKAFPEKLVIVDEAYIDFADSLSFITELQNFENLVVLQTFSKAWGMAGLRLGVAYCNPFIIKILNKIKYPYNLNILTQQKLVEALEKVAEKNEFVEKINQLRVELASELLKISSVVKIYPSDSNMLLVKFKEAKKLFDYLLSQKVIVRDRSNVVLCEDCLRLSIGTKEENEILLNAIKSSV